MVKGLSYFVCFVTFTAAALAQSSTDQTRIVSPVDRGTAAVPESSSAPVAFVYVSRPTHVDAFAVSSAGKLTAVPGSPFSNIALSHMSVNKKFLFGASDDGKDIITYSIASNGALKKVGEIDALLYTDDTDCGPVGPTQIDHTGATVYNFQANCDDTAWTQSFNIEGNGELKYMNRVPTNEDLALSPPAFLGNNKYAYITGGAFEQPASTFIYKRESDGMLSEVYPTVNYPKPETSGDVFGAVQVLATDPTDHLAMLLYPEDPNTGDSDGPAVLVSYTAGSEGGLKTTNTYKDAPRTGLEAVGEMSISSSGKLLALGTGSGPFKGFQVFHFDGGNPIKKFTGVLHSSENFLQFGWDKSNHLFALSTSALHVYSATSTSIKEEPGSPISIPEASSVIVLSLN